MISCCSNRLSEGGLVVDLLTLVGGASDSVYNDASASRRPLELKTFPTKMVAMGLLSVVLAALIAVGATMDVQSDGSQMFMVSVAGER